MGLESNEATNGPFVQACVPVKERALVLALLAATDAGVVFMGPAARPAIAGSYRRGNGEDWELAAGPARRRCVAGQLRIAERT
jgi:hypothetical protein